MRNRIKPRANALKAEREAKQAERRLAKERQRAERRAAADVGPEKPVGGVEGAPE
jgi:hypothetical protein